MTKLIYTLVAATSIDGKIAAPGFEGAHWTSKEDKEFLHNFLDTSDVVVVGNTTYKLAEEPLSKRNCIVFTRKKLVSKRARKNLVYFDPERNDIDSYIKSKGYKKVAILGGSQVYSYFFEHELVDDIYLTIEPIFFGEGTPFVRMQKVVRRDFFLKSKKKINRNGTLLLHYTWKLVDKKRPHQTVVETSRQSRVVNSFLNL